MNDKKSLGMYEMGNPNYPKVKVGEYTICRQDENSVWIQREDGEGGQFSDSKFVLAIDKFYQENF